MHLFTMVRRLSNGCRKQWLGLNDGHIRWTRCSCLDSNCYSAETTWRNRWVLCGWHFTQVDRWRSQDLSAHPVLTARLYLHLRSGRKRLYTNRLKIAAMHRAKGLALSHVEHLDVLVDVFCKACCVFRVLHSLLCITCNPESG